MTDQEINKAVAQRLGYSVEVINGYRCKVLGQIKEGISCCDLKSYCTDIRAAWEIVEHVLSEDKFFHLQMGDKNCEATICWHNTLAILKSYSAEADTAPMAIALAFLKLP